MAYLRRLYAGLKLQINEAKSAVTSALGCTFLGYGLWGPRVRPYLLGWKAYFGMAQTPRVWRKLDEWLRHRLRALQLTHWKCGRT